ncbi:basement membrane-specific heparan sulfate proteoglycan core protein-like [Xenentodon cancila]
MSPQAASPDTEEMSPHNASSEGQNLELSCFAPGNPPPRVTWTRASGRLSANHQVVGRRPARRTLGNMYAACRATLGTLVSTRPLSLCLLLHVVQAAVPSALETQDAPPYATSMPDDVAVRVGEVIRLQCLAHGTPPLTYTWTKLEGSLPSRAEVSGGDLQINLATAEDAGSYKCVASNKVGHSEAVAKVTVRSPLAVRVSPQVEVKAQGSAVEFTCSAAGGVETKIEWLKEGGALPPNHHIKDGVLRIENLEQSNEGVYICRASSVYGQAQDTARLTIQEADAGHYRCTATNDVGSVQSQVVLNVQW